MLIWLLSWLSGLVEDLQQLTPRVFDAARIVNAKAAETAFFLQAELVRFTALQFGRTPSAIADIPQTLFEWRVDKHKVVTDLVPTRLEKHGRIKHHDRVLARCSSFADLPRDLLTNEGMNDRLKVEAIGFMSGCCSKDETPEDRTLDFLIGVERGVTKPLANHCLDGIELQHIVANAVRINDENRAVLSHPACDGGFPRSDASDDSYHRSIHGLQMGQRGGGMLGVDCNPLHMGQRVRSERIQMGNVRVHVGGSDPGCQRKPGWSCVMRYASGISISSRSTPSRTSSSFMPFLSIARLMASCASMSPASVNRRSDSLSSTMPCLPPT